MWMFPIFDFIKANKWAQVVLIAIAAIATIGLYLVWRDNGVRQRAKAQFEVEKVRERAKMLERKSQIITEERTNADAALAARDHGEHHTTYDELSEPHKAIAEGRVVYPRPDSR